MKKITILLLVLLSALRLNAQGLNSDGRDFYVGYLYPSFNSYSGTVNVTSFFGVYVLISSYSDNTVTISNFDNNGKELNKQQYSIQAHKTLQLPIDRALMRMTDPGGTPEYKAMHIKAAFPVNVQYFSTGACSGGSYLSLPTNTLGKNYVVESYHDNPNGKGGILSNDNSAGYCMVIAPFDNTSVTITPASTTQAPIGGNPHIGTYCGTASELIPHPFTIQLSRGQCYMLKSEGKDAACDLSGTTITGDKPLAVIAGHENALTDGSDVGTINVEQRDFMIEQMLPVEYWDTAGYVVVPFIDSKGAPGGNGDEVRVFFDSGSYSSLHGTNALVSESPSNTLFGPPMYPHDTITTPRHYFSTNGKKFHLAQYDQRAQGSSPFPCPSQMTIIPKSLWKTSYAWFVPANTFEVLQGYYITLICRKTDFDHDSILVGFNGGKPASIKKNFSIQRTYSLPDFPDYTGVILKMTSGSFYATSIAKGSDNKGNQPFMIYNYGFRGVDPDRDLGDFDGDDYFFSYALPIGFSAHTGHTSHLTVRVDTECGKWNVCTNSNGSGIRSIEIVNDPNGDYIPGRAVSYNVKLDSANDPNGMNEVVYPGIDTQVCVSIQVINNFDSAAASVYIVDNEGNGQLVPLHFSGKNLTTRITPTTFGSAGKDSIVFPPTAIGDQKCATFTCINATAGQSTTITAASLKSSSTAFAVTSTIPALPVTLSQGDSLSITVCFTPTDTSIASDILVLKTDCSPVEIAVLGQSGSGIIHAGDVDFGMQVVDSTTCAGKIIVQNIGNFPFTIEGANLSGSSAFSIAMGNLQKFPKVLYPANDPSHPHKDTMQVSVCYTPASLGPDSAVCTWLTNISTPFLAKGKLVSRLSGVGVKAGVHWSAPTASDSATSQSSIVYRVILTNNSHSTRHIREVFFAGKDTAEYSIHGNQMNYNPLSDFPLNSGDQIWIDYQWKPNVNGPRGTAPRLVSLIATYDNGTSEVDSAALPITGILPDTTVAEVAPTHTAPSSIHAFVTGNLLHIEPVDPLSVRSIVLFDILGKKLGEWKASEATVSNSGLDLNIPMLLSGTYIVQLSTDSEPVNTVFQILR